MPATWRRRPLILAAVLLFLMAADFTPPADSALRAHADALAAQHEAHPGHRLLPDGLASLRARFV